MLIRSIISYRNADLEPLVQTANGTIPIVNSDPEPETPVYTYPIEQFIGEIPTTGTFDDFTNIQQIAVSAVRTGNNMTAIQEQYDDYVVIAAQNPGGLAGNVEMNLAFLVTYSTPLMSTEVFESWTAYNNWILGIEDIRSSWDLNGETIYQKWDGSVLDFRGYKGWYIHEKSSAFNAVIYP